MKMTFRILESPDPAERGQTMVVDMSEHDSLTIGRKFDTRFPLTGGGYISRRHLVLEVNGPQCFIRDLGSRNGTFVRRRNKPDKPASWKQILFGQATPIFNGDYVRLGQRQGSRTVLQIQFQVPDVETHAEKPLIYCTQCGDPVLESVTAGSGFYICPDCRDQAAAQPDVARLPNDITPDYQPLEELGRGGMGVIYRAQRVTPGHPLVPPGTTVALKTIIPQKSLSQKDRERFKRETDVCEVLTHPHIVRYFDRCSFREGERLWFVLEYIEGDNAGERSPFSLDETIVIAKQILDALDYAHRAEIPSEIGGEKRIQHGAVHRDIKPGNILVSGRGAALQAKLTDFGLAKGFQFAGQSHFTDTSEVRGTPYYMSPEQVLSFRDVRPVGDIYSLGATLYTLLTAKLPYGPSSKDVFVQILEDSVIPPQELETFLHQSDTRWKALVQVIHKATLKGPEDRYQSAAEMLAALAEIPPQRKGLRRLQAGS